MCLNTSSITCYNITSKQILRKLKKETRKIATEDIRVYKHLMPKYDIYGRRTWKSPHYEFIYEPNTHYYEVGKRLQIAVQTAWDAQYVYLLTINQGLHAYTNRKRAKRQASYKVGDKVAIMYIPKGAIYYLGNNDDIVSTDLIWYGSFTK